MLKQAIHWWQRQTMAKQEANAEMLREGALQELFALRRSLELSLAADPSEAAERQLCWLSSLSQISLSLDQLKQTLHPAYISDSLPLALQSRVERWRRQMPQTQFSLTIPPIWPVNCSYGNWLLLTVLDEMMLFLEPYLIAGATIALGLEHHLLMQKLTINLVNASLNGALLGSATTLEHLKTIFEELVTGEWSSQLENEQVLWHLHWPPRLP